MVDRGIWYRRGCPKRSWRYCTATLGVRQQIQRVGGRLLVSEVKTERSRRMIPLPPIALVALKARRLEQARIKLASHNAWPSDLILTTKHGTPVEPRNLARSFDRLCRAAQVPVIRLHDTRHTCASLLATIGVSPRTIMAILGHSQIAVTMNVYTHVTTEEQRQAVALLDKLLTAEDGSSVGR